MENSLFKFCSSISYLPEILEGKLRFTPPAELNDPSELLPRFDFEEVRASLADLRSRGHTPDELEGLRRQAALMELLCPELQRMPTPQTRAQADASLTLPVFDDIELVHSTFSMMTRVIAERVGVCCLTKKFRSLPMWSHYANRANGYVVEYWELDKESVGDATGLLNCIRPVVYSREFSGVSFYPDSYDRIFFTKFRDWEYEQELRVVSRLTDCECSPGKERAIYTRTVSTKHIKSITLGWMLDEGSRTLAKHQIEETFGNRVPLYQAHIDKGEVQTRRLTTRN